MPKGHKYVTEYIFHNEFYDKAGTAQWISKANCRKNGWVLWKPKSTN